MNNRKHRKQRQRRRAGFVRRVEFVLLDSDRDEEISHHLDSLEPGERSEFIRQAIYAAMGQGNIPEKEPQPTQSTGDSFNTAMAELDAKICVLQQLAEAIGQQPTQPPPAPPESPAMVESSGLDMSRPRRRKSAHRAPPSSAPDVAAEPEFDEEASRRLLLSSIRGFGKHA